MQLTFESLAELQDFVQWVQAARTIGESIAPRQATIVVKDLPEVSAPERVPESEPVPEEPEAIKAADDKPARKRRTKAEMEAARAAESAEEKSEAVGETPVESAITGSTNAAEVTAAITQVVVPDPSAQLEAQMEADDFIKSRLAERPEVSQVEHLNLARTFIGKHGMEKYNQSFPLAGLTPNVMGYSPADCATHAAALDFLSLE